MSRLAYLRRFRSGADHRRTPDQGGLTAVKGPDDGAKGPIGSDVGGSATEVFWHSGALQIGLLLRKYHSRKSEVNGPKSQKNERDD